MSNRPSRAYTHGEFIQARGRRQAPRVAARSNDPFTNPFPAAKRGSPCHRLWYDDYGFLSDIASLRFIRERGFKPTAFGCSKLRLAALQNKCRSRKTAEGCRSRPSCCHFLLFDLFGTA